MSGSPFPMHRHRGEGSAFARKYHRTVFSRLRGGLFAGLLVFVAMPCRGLASETGSGRHYYDDQTVSEAREKVSRFDWAQRQQRAMEERVAPILGMSDRELWDYVPPVTQPRALNVAFNVGCPVHGTEVLREGGPYPWIMSRDKPFKVECPVDGEVYPTNDFVPWHHGGREGEADTSEPYVDDGTGYVGPDGQVYHFVAHYIFWQRWREDVLSRLRDLRDLYLLTDDKRYARAAAILLVRIATEYPEADYQAQSVHRGRPHDIRGGILDYIWENGAVVGPAATTFDAISPALDDLEVVEFIRARGIEDPKRLIEDNLLFELVNRITRGRNGEHENRIWGNFGMYQRSLAELAVVLSNDNPGRGLTSDEIVEWIMRPGNWDETGAIEDALWNRFYRDGHGGEASPGYSAGWANSVSSVARVLAKRDYNLYEHPRMRRLVDVWLDMALLGEWTPSIGDSGGIFGSRRRGWLRNILLPAYEALGDPRWAKALEMIGVRDNQLWENVPLERIREDAAAYGAWPIGGAGLLGGYGLAIAESPSAPVGLSLYYGYAGGGHGHRDRLNIEMFALDRPVLPDHGYPTPLGDMVTSPKRFLWTSNTIAHYGVTENRKWQQTVDRGRLNRLVSTPDLQMIDASAEDVAYPGETSLYRRTSLLVENPEGRPYLFDVFRVAGGWEHVWSFHGPPFERFTTFALNPGPAQESGTLAGEEVGFGEEPTDAATDETSGFQYLFNVREDASPAASWGAIWSRADDGAHVRMTALPSAVTRVVVADAEPELKENHPKTMPYLLAFNGSGDPKDGRGARSDFVAVVEAYEGSESLGEIRSLNTQGAAHAVAASIRRKEGFDLIVSELSSDDESAVQIPGEGDRSLEFKGELSYLAIDSDEVSRASLVNVRRLISPWLEVEMAGDLRGKIAKADYSGNFIVLDRLVAGAAALVGKTVVVGNDRHSTAFEVAAVDEVEGATALLFGDVPMLAGMGQVRRVGDSALSTRTEFGKWQTDGGKHVGRHIVDTHRERAFFIQELEDATFQLASEGAKLGDLFSEDESDERNRFWITETGRGDAWEIPAVFSIEKQDSNEDADVSYVATLNAAARVTLRVSGDAGDDWTFLTADGEWAPLPVVRRDG